MYILGISAFYHDSSAALIHNGEIIAAAEEERFTRKKHDDSFPIESLKFCLDFAGITISDIDHLVFYDKPLLTFDRLIETHLGMAPKGVQSFCHSLPLWLKDKLFQKANIKKALQALSPEEDAGLPEIYFSSHHLSHAASAFFASPFNEAAVLCLDGVGEWATTTLWHGKNNNLELKWQINFPHSLGLLYSAFTYFCGFKVNSGEYKLMGLAPYGQPVFCDLIKKELIHIKSDGTFCLNLKYFSYATGLKMTNHHFSKLFGINPRLEHEPLLEIHMNIAASIQKVLEECILLLAKTAAQEIGSENLCLAGGVALNCVANGKIYSQRIFKHIWVQPASNDAGGAIGCALASYYMRTGHKRISCRGPDHMQGTYLGPQFSDQEIETAIKEAGVPFDFFSNESELLDKVSHFLHENKVVGWFQGRSEFGPRALGSRSILGNSESEELQKTLNLKIKFRESFRPFAPAVLEEKVSQYFEFEGQSPYMLMVANVKSDYLKCSSEDIKKYSGLEKLYVNRSKLQAITHVDFSARIQTVNRESNARFYDLIKSFSKLGHSEVVINTSFNIRGEPIVNRPSEAINCFLKTNMDVLCIGNYILNKQNIPDQLKNVSVYISENSKSIQFPTIQEVRKLWRSVCLGLLILFYVTLPFFGHQRRIIPVIIIGLIFLVSQFIPSSMVKITYYKKKLFSFIAKVINSTVLGTFYYFMFLPYAFMSQKMKWIRFESSRSVKLESYRQAPENVSVSSHQF